MCTSYSLKVLFFTTVCLPGHLHWFFMSFCWGGTQGLSWHLWGIAGKLCPARAHAPDRLHKLCKSSALGIWSGYARINWACCFHEVWEQWVTLHRGTYVEKLPARCQKKMCFVTAASAVGQHMLQKCSGCAGNQLELGALTRSREHRNPTQMSRNFSAGKENTK